jgi:hypothetical protein
LSAALVKRPYWLLRRHAKLMHRALAILPRMGRGVMGWLLKRTDSARWEDSTNLEAWWEARTVRLARLVPAGARVIEFGAGRCRLPTHLDPSCFYVPSDLVPRVPGTIVCDLNKPPLPDLRHLALDVAFFAGVFEYVGNVASVAEWLSTQVNMCVASYDGVDAPRWSARRVVELGRRKYFGYLNDYSPAEFVGVFERAGFKRVYDDRWESQELYLFAKDPSRLGGSRPPFSPPVRATNR